MAAVNPLCSILGVDTKPLSKAEMLVLEAELYFCLCKELKNYFKAQHCDYIRLLKFDMEKENLMLDNHYIRWMIEDILSSQQYTLGGIAYYTNTPEEIVYETLMGSHSRPAAIFLERMIALHREVKSDLYNSIGKKIAQDYLEKYQVNATEIR